MKDGWVYIMADGYRGTLYIGVTSNLAARVWAHREGRGSKFCARYGLKRLVYAEEAPTIMLFSADNVTVRSEAVQNYVQHGAGWYYGLARAWKK